MVVRLLTPILWFIIVESLQDSKQMLRATAAELVGLIASALGKLDVNLLGWQWIAGTSFKFLCNGASRHNWHWRAFWGHHLDPMSIVFRLPPWVYIFLGNEKRIST
jgi:hypothetical protein